MEAQVQFQCPFCKTEMSVAYWRVGMAIPCASCRKEIQITLNQPVSFHYETTYAEFIRVLAQLKDYVGIQRFISDSLGIVDFDLSKNSATREDGSILTLAELHGSIQQKPEWQNFFYNRRMDVER